jgi:hypothetical protein
MELVKFNLKKGVPFGIVGLVFSKSVNYPTSFDNEKNWFFLTEKTWSTQRFYLDKLLSTTDKFKTLNISSSIPIHIISTNYNTSVIQASCDRNKVSNCDYNIRANNLTNSLKLSMVNQNGGRTILCTEPYCNQAYYTYGKPVWTIDQILQIYQ